jgi:hypothetical protein
VDGPFAISSVKIVALTVRDMNFMRRGIGQVIIALAVDRRRIDPWSCRQRRRSNRRGIRKALTPRAAITAFSAIVGSAMLAKRATRFGVRSLAIDVAMGTQIGMRSDFSETSPVFRSRRGHEHGIIILS